MISYSITLDDNFQLTAHFSKEEFRVAIFSMHLDKCPGPNGYNLGFYQHLWNLYNDDIFKDCIFWLDSGHFPSNLNTTILLSFPKITIKPLCVIGVPFPFATFFIS